MNELKMKNKRISVIDLILCLALLYPAWQVGQWVANHVWSAIYEATSEKSQGMLVVVDPMLPITISGKIVYVQGTDICPDTGMHSCIVVTPRTSIVWVSLITDGTLDENEAWHVDRDGDNVFFRRPDGSPVVLAEAS